CAFFFFFLAQEGPAGPWGPFPPGPPAGASFEILTIPEVQRELSLSDEQRQSIVQALTTLREQRRTQFEKLMRGPGPQSGVDEVPGGNQPPASLEATFDAFRKIAEQTEAAILESLDDQQKKRFAQLRRQQQGVRGLLDPEVRDALKIDQRQADAIESLVGGGPFAPPPDERQTLDVLSEDQRGQWRALLGKPLEALAQQRPRDGFGPPGGPGGFGPPGFGQPGFGPPGFGPPGGPEFRPGGFGPGGPNTRRTKIVAKFDANKDGWLDAAERAEARDEAKTSGGGRGPRGGPRGFGGGETTPTPGPHVEPSEVAQYPDEQLYDLAAIRTYFLQFEADDWERELSDFHGTDVDVAAEMQVDGATFENVGVRFRGMSSYMMVREGSKRSFNISLDHANPEQRFHGRKTLNLLNSNGDPSFMSSVLYSHIARQYIAAPKANLAKVVVNGESWGVYVSAEQFDRDFAEERFGEGAARWKVPGSPGGRGGLEYLGEEVEPYRARYAIKSRDEDESWQALIELCRTLNETPADKLEEALRPILDIDSTLWFLALDVTLANSDGYWTRASDYSIVRDGNGTFHFVPHDMNEAFQSHGGGPGGPGGPGGRGRRGRRFDAEPNAAGPARTDGQRDRFREGFPPGGPMGRGEPAQIDPLVGLDDPTKPLRSKLLA
ncbi:MAG: CotH kinase family protein, partial [Planctomycetales bacterium]|nr:CotH kinase family protein [Planctomycetales bacterium]